MQRKLGLIAGTGILPNLIINECKSRNREVVVFLMLYKGVKLKTLGGGQGGWPDQEFNTGLRGGCPGEQFS